MATNNQPTFESIAITMNGVPLPPNHDLGTPVVEVMADGRARITGINRTWFADLAPHPFVELGLRITDHSGASVLAIEWDGDALLTDALLPATTVIGASGIEMGSLQFIDVGFEPVSSNAHLSKYRLPLPKAMETSERLRAGERLVAVLIEGEFWRIQPEPAWLRTNGLARHRTRG